MERKTKTDNKIIFNQALAGYLMMQGFILKKMERNENVQTRMYLFLDNLRIWKRQSKNTYLNNQTRRATKYGNKYKKSK